MEESEMEPTLLLVGVLNSLSAGEQTGGGGHEGVNDVEAVSLQGGAGGSVINNDISIIRRETLGGAESLNESGVKAELGNPVLGEPEQEKARCWDVLQKRVG